MRLNFKRLHLLCGKASRACAALVEITPARLDLMTTLLRHERSQTEIAQVLCVADSVVSRMVRALLELGLVQRRIPSEDRRLRLVSLTRRGLQQIEPVLYDPIPEDGTRGATCVGEHAWLLYWKKPLARMGLELEPILQSVVSSFRMLRLLNRADAYLPWLLGESDQPFVPLQ